MTFSFAGPLTGVWRLTTVKNVSNNTGLSRFPTMTADGTKVWLAWTDRTPVNDDICLSIS